MTDSTPQTMLSTAVRPALPQAMPRSGWKQPTPGPAGGPSGTQQPLTPKRDRDSVDESHKSKKAKRKGGKACVYCRRSHMVCEGGRPCERCIKRDIAHLCRDVTPPSSAKKPDQPAAPAAAAAIPKSEPQSLVYDTGSSSWPLLPPNTAPEPPQPETQAPAPALDLGVMTRDVSNVSSGGWGVGDNAEFGILSDMLKTLRVPTLPGGFVDVLSQVVRRGSNDPSITDPQLAGGTSSALQLQGAAPAQSSSSSSTSGQAPPDVKGKGKAEPFSSISRIEQYLLAAADQPDGTRAARLTQVIRAKYEAGLLKPYDYIKGYERMNRWMDSGRAARIDASRAPSPTKGNRRYVVPPPPSGSSISPDSRRRILAALEVFRPKFRRIAKELTDLDLVFVEEANERLMLQYDRALASIHTPSCIWRRTGEIQKANQEFASLTGIPAPLFRNGQLCVYELMDEDSAVRFWEGYGKVASEKGQSHLYTYCTLKIPLSLTRAGQQSRTQGNTPSVVPMTQTGSVPDLMLPQAAVGPLSSSGQPAGTVDEEYRVIRTCFSMTIRRDRYEIPVAIMGQWIPIL